MKLLGIITLGLGNVAWLCYLWSSLFLLVVHTWRPGVRMRALNLIWQWSKWPAFASLFVMPVAEIVFLGQPNMWDYATWLMNGWLWWAYRNSGDDDLDKKLKKKLDEVVERVEGKLVVVRTA